MIITITPRKLQGNINIIPSKSQAHRYLICAAFSDCETQIICPAVNQDIEATVACLNALGADIQRTETGYDVIPIKAVPTKATLSCGESGSTLRFMLPIAGALGVFTDFILEGRLSQRPLSPLWEEMERMGCQLSWVNKNTLRCAGKLQHGVYNIDGSVSSQFITGLLFALSLIPGESTLNITGMIESKPYIDMTLEALTTFGVMIDNTKLKGQFPFHSPKIAKIEGDWSNGAFFLAARSLGNNINVDGLNARSKQGDRAVQAILNAMANFIEIDAKDIPDLVPILSVVAAASKGAKFCNIRRLRLKESDRVQTVMDMLQAFGIHSASDENTLTVYPGIFQGCTVDSANDHRIAMSAGIAATIANGPVTILNAQCVAKSYPAFWEEYRQLGGTYEQYLRK